MYDILKEISNLAHSELNQNGSISYTLSNGKFHLFIYVEDSNGEDDTFYMIEANKSDGAGGWMPIDTSSADYTVDNNFEELLLECVRCITMYFDFSSDEMIDIMRNNCKC